MRNWNEALGEWSPFHTSDAERAAGFGAQYGTSPTAGRNYAGDIATETMTATGPAPVANTPVGSSTNGGSMTWTTPPVTSSNPADLFSGGDPMFYNAGMPQSRFPGFSQELGSMQAGPGAIMAPGGGGMPGFAGAIGGIGQTISGAAGGLWDWIKENPEGAAALASVGANIYGAHEQGELADEEIRMRREDRERQRELSQVLTPYLGQVIAGRRR